METNEKAKLLFEAYKKYMHPFHDEVSKKQAKECVKITINEILQDDWFLEKEQQEARKKYWNEVIKKLEEL
jgi:hypothetical protein